MPKRTTNEWEFQGQVLTWLNEEIARNPGYRLDKATQEPSLVDRKRSDLVIWRDRSSHIALLTLEIKTPDTKLYDVQLLRDAERKARHWKSPYFAIWNMVGAELYKSPDATQRATPDDRRRAWPPNTSVHDVASWLDPKVARELREVAVDILDTANYLSITRSRVATQPDASIFVEKLGARVRQITSAITPVLRLEAAKNRRLRERLRSYAATQGFLSFVEDLDSAIAFQYAYRLAGQLLFYMALRRKHGALPDLSLPDSNRVIERLREYWDHARRYDYEAVFALSILEEVVPLSPTAETLVYSLAAELRGWDWSLIPDDVLGAIFERLIPESERKLLGQFYTKPEVADLLVALTVTPGGVVLDPGCGSGTFLMRSYSYLQEVTQVSHEDLLSVLWGFDISPFAAELAAINLFRQDFSCHTNFPRIAPRDFFSLGSGDLIPFPPARDEGTGDACLEVPKFSAIIGNPPYVRSQHLDDLDSGYKAKLFSVAAGIGVRPEPKTDLFVFFIVKSMEMLKEEGRIGFVVSSSWLTSGYGMVVKSLLVERFTSFVLIWSQVESFFPQADVNTILVIASRSAVGSSPARVARFVTLKKPLSQLVSGKDYWSRVRTFVDSLDFADVSVEDDKRRVRLISTASADERGDLVNRSNWSALLRAPLSYSILFGDHDACE